MKKLMIAAAAALCATVGYSDLESANTVGYLNKSVRKNLSQQVCTFDQIGVAGGALDIQNLLPVDDDGEVVGDGEATIQFITDLGKLTTQYSYYLARELSQSQTEAGWYDDDEELAEYSFAAGEAFQVSAASALHFIYAGEVNMAETDVPFRRNLSFQANVRPTPVDIQSVIPVDGNDDEAEVIGDGDVTIQIFSALGKIQTQYSYYLARELSQSQTEAGWYDDDEEYADKEFVAGEGFKLSAAQAGYLRFPEL